MSFLDAIGAISKTQREEAEVASVASATPAKMTARATGDGDPEIQSMNEEAPLLDLIRADTGETGRETGDRIDFHHCPVCGHLDCFRYYPTSNSWSCFGDSNETGYEGGSYVEYQRAVHNMTATEAVKSLREATAHPYKGRADADGCGEVVETVMPPEEGEKLKLPPWGAVCAVDPPRRNPVLIHDILRRGHVALLTGKGKGSKTWSAIECSVAVATGGSWFGFRCEAGRVLHIDPELDRKSLDTRFAKVCEALGADAALVDARASKWCLRGVPDASMESLIHDLTVRGDEARFDLVVIDSASCFVEGDENSSTDLRRFASHVLRVASITGAAILLIHHMGKGNAGDRDSIERSRGSSVWGDFPDAPLSLTEVFPKEGKPSDYLADGERAFVLEDSGLREFPSIEPRRLIFSYPVHRIDADGTTADWRPRTTQGRSRGGKQTAELNKARKTAEQAGIISDLLGWFYAEGVGRDGKNLKECAERVGMDSRKVRAAVEESTLLDIYKISSRKSFVVPVHPPKADFGEPTLFGGESN